MTERAEDELLLKAIVEFGADYLYTIRLSTHGLTLYVDAGSKEASCVARATLPMYWEGLYIMVLCTGPRKEEEEDVLDWSNTSA